MKIIIETIKHENQEYETCGNWMFDKKGNLHIWVSDTKNNDYFFLIGIHEAIEAWLCRKRGIDERKITDFDITFEANRKDGDDSEPGDNEKAPYKNEHLFATGIEKLVASALQIGWNEYEKTINKL